MEPKGKEDSDCTSDFEDDSNTDEEMDQFPPP